MIIMTIGKKIYSIYFSLKSGKNKLSIKNHCSIFYQLPKPQLPYKHSCRYLVAFTVIVVINTPKKSLKKKKSIVRFFLC